MKSLSLKLSRTLEARLAAAARRSGRSKSAMVREALQAYLSRSGDAAVTSFATLAKDFLGCVDGGPPDLSYNQKLLKGLGK